MTVCPACNKEALFTPVVECICSGCGAFYQRDVGTICPSCGKSKIHCTRGKTCMKCGVTTH